MRLKDKQSSTNIHSDLVSCIGWNAWGEAYSASDDKSICKWDMSGEAQGKVCEMDVYFTDLHWFPAGTKRAQAGSDVFVAACTDGTFKILARNGRVEKSVDAHKGAVIAIRWNYEGTAVVTVGEDGLVKVWSRAGMLRSTLAQSPTAVYGVAWGPDSDQVMFTGGKDLVIKPLQQSNKASGSKPQQWKAHDGTILKVDWNPINNMIVSGAEDLKYKVWDCFGRLLYSSQPMSHPVTSVAWCPDGELFAVGSFNALNLCDKTGWTYCKQKPQTGSVLNIAWSTDGTQLAGAGGNGSVYFGQVVDRTLEWRRVVANLEEAARIRVHDVVNETMEDLDFRDSVTKMSLGHGHLVATTTTQCCIYSTNNWNTPHIFDIKDTVNLIMQCEKHFLMVDNFAGLQIFSYEGRQVCNPKFQGLRTEFLNTQSVSLANDTIAIVDRSYHDPTAAKEDGAPPAVCAVRFFDATNGKAIGSPLPHNLEILSISLNQIGPSTERMLIFVDRNRDMYITPVHKPYPFKLGTMVDSAMWNDSTNMLAAMVDQKLVVWHYPNVVYVDKDLMPLTKYVKDGAEFGQAAQITYFSGSRCTVRRSDGALVTASVSPYPLLLYEHVQQGKWESATRLCRFVKDNSLWACLAAMAIQAKELNTAEVAFAAIDEVDKLQYVLHIKGIPTEEGRNAELALFRRRPDEAEAILLQAGLTYRAIKMNVKLFNWERALELAVNYKTHVDTVLYYREDYLKAARRPETNQRFLQYSQQVQVDAETIKAKIAQEKENEANRPGAKRYV